MIVIHIFVFITIANTAYVETSKICLENDIIFHEDNYKWLLWRVRGIVLDEQRLFDFAWSL